MKQKNYNRVYKKKTLFRIFFGLFGGKTHPGLRYKHEKSSFACKFFFVKFTFEHKSKFATEKGIKTFLPQICVFAHEKCIPYN